jgi:hypothetical protein
MHREILISMYRKSGCLYTISNFLIEFLCY